MSRVAKIVLLFVAILGAGCAGVPVDQLHIYNGMVTVGGSGNRFEETPITSISQKNRLFVITHVSWDNVKIDAGTHIVKWQWFSSDKLVAERSKNLHFAHTPYRMWYSFPAADFQVGQYKVVVLIDEKVVDTQEFKITE